MPLAARWVRTQPADEEEFRATHAALAESQAPRAAPIVLWRQGSERKDFALIVPRGHAPGRASRWTAWALSPALATLRHFGLPAYLGEHGVQLHGRPFAASTIEAIGECVVAASSLDVPFPVERHVEERFRARIEAQYDWQFETSWPTPGEARAIAGLVGALA